MALALAAVALVASAADAPSTKVEPKDRWHLYGGLG